MLALIRSGRPRRYRVVIDEPAYPELQRGTTVWAYSSGHAVDAVILRLDANERVNVDGSPARVEAIGDRPDPEVDLRAADEGWPEPLPESHYYASGDEGPDWVDRGLKLAVFGGPFALGVGVALVLVRLL